MVRNKGYKTHIGLVTHRGVTRGARAAIPSTPNHYGGAPNHCGGAEKSEKCCKYFLQCSEFISERAQSIYQTK